MSDQATAAGDRLAHIADLLMGAAHADGRLLGEEVDAVKAILGAIVGGDLPAEVVERMAGFDPGALDLEAACGALALDGPKERRGLLALLARVSDADDVQDLDEASYIRRVAACIGAEPDELKGLTVEIVEEGLLSPPPIPADG